MKWYGNEHTLCEAGPRIVKTIGVVYTGGVVCEWATLQARNQDFMWGGANEAKADPTTEMYFLSSDPFI